MAPTAVLRTALAAGFAGMGVTHFVPGVAKGMAAMVPRSITKGDRRTAMGLVRFTGVCELAGAAGLLVPQTRRAAGGALIAFLAAVFPANAVAAADRERFGWTAAPLVPRAVAQAALAGLVAAAAFPRVSR